MKLHVQFRLKIQLTILLIALMTTAANSAASVGMDTIIQSDVMKQSSPPGCPVASPASGTFFQSPISVTVTSDHASYIEYEILDTTFNPCFPGHKGIITNPGTIYLEGINGAVTSIELALVGYSVRGVASETSYYGYRIDLTGNAIYPASAVISPNFKTWKIVPQNIQVESANASEIEYIYSLTTDGSEPLINVTEPFSSEPLKTNEKRGNVSGSTGTIIVATTPAKNVIAVEWGRLNQIRMKCAGKNVYGVGGSASAFLLST